MSGCDHCSCWEIDRAVCCKCGVAWGAEAPHVETMSDEAYARVKNATASLIEGWKQANTMLGIPILQGDLLDQRIPRPWFTDEEHAAIAITLGQFCESEWGANFSYSPTDDPVWGLRLEGDGTITVDYGDDNVIEEVDHG